jgi:hypothetical protein
MSVFTFLRFSVLQSSSRKTPACCQHGQSQIAAGTQKPSMRRCVDALYNSAQPNTMSDHDIASASLAKLRAAMTTTTCESSLQLLQQALSVRNDNIVKEVKNKTTNLTQKLPTKLCLTLLVQLTQPAYPTTTSMSQHCKLPAK